MLLINLGIKRRYNKSWKYINFVGETQHIIKSLENLLNDEEVEKISIDKGDNKNE